MSTVALAVASHPATVAVHQAVVEPYCTRNTLIYLSSSHHQQHHDHTTFVVCLLQTNVKT